jgi:type VI secretion system secreted protein Hcp
MPIFAKFDGIDGESTDADHARWIEIESFNWGLLSPTGATEGNARRLGAAAIQAFGLAFRYEKAAPKLLDKCAKGAVIPRLNIELTSPTGGHPTTYLRYQFKNVSVSSYIATASTTDQDAPPIVSLALGCEKAQVTYTEFDDTGVSHGNVETSVKIRR